MSERPAKSGAAVALVGVLILSAFVWVALAIASIHKTPGLAGILTGVFVGGFAALLVALAGCWAVVFLVARPAKAAAERPPPVIDGDLGQVLAELEMARAQTARGINAQAAWRIPLACAGAVGFWIFSQFGKDPADLSDLLVFLVFACLAGYIWASSALGGAYRRLYKERVLPKLAARFGDLSWRPAQPELDGLKRHRVFEDWDGCDADDEIYGQYRGLPISIVELKLTKGSGKNERTIFNGLTCSVALPRGLKGVTVVVPDRGMVGNFAERLKGGPCQQVRVEDPTFEKAYEVYGTDQISARALLTPAFMERFMALATSGRFGAPVALVQDNRLLMALDTGGRNLFEPPSYRKPAAGREALTQLMDDIESVLKAADAIIDLDQAARRQPLRGQATP